MNFELDNYCQIMNVNPDDSLEHLRKLLSPYLYNWTFKYFIRTRNYELGLHFIGICYMIISLNATAISKEEYARFDRDLILGKLRMLDRLNRWQEYIATFNYVRENKEYAFIYSAKSLGIDIKAPNALPDKDSYILKIANEYVAVHFLYTISDEYEKVKRKYERLCSGKSVDHLKRHSQESLTDYELNRRLAELCFQLKNIVDTYHLE